MSDDLNLGEREDHPAASGEEFRLALHDALLEVPRQHKEVIRLHRPRLGLGNDRNAGAGCEGAKFLRIDLGDGYHLLGGHAAELQHDVAFGRGAVAHHCLAVGRERLQQAHQVGRGGDRRVPRNPDRGAACQAPSVPPAPAAIR